MPEYMGWTKKRGQSSYLLHMWADTGNGVRPLCDPHYPPHIKKRPGDRIEQFYYRQLNNAIDYKTCTRCHSRLPEEISNNLYTQDYLPWKAEQ